MVIQKIVFLIVILKWVELVLRQVCIEDVLFFYTRQTLRDIFECVQILYWQGNHQNILHNLIFLK